MQYNAKATPRDAVADRFRDLSITYGWNKTRVRLFFMVWSLDLKWR